MRWMAFGLCRTCLFPRHRINIKHKHFKQLMVHGCCGLSDRDVRCVFLRLCAVGTATLYDFCRTEPKIKVRIVSQLQPQYRGSNEMSNKNKFFFLNFLVASRQMKLV